MRDGANQRLWALALGLVVCGGFAMCQHVPMREAPRVAPPPPVIPMVRQPSTDAASPLELAVPSRVVLVSVAPSKPPLDAGVDGGVPLPPLSLPDGGLLHDAAAPMQ